MTIISAIHDIAHRRQFLNRRRGKVGPVDRDIGAIFAYGRGYRLASMSIVSHRLAILLPSERRQFLKPLTILAAIILAFTAHIHIHRLAILSPSRYPTYLCRMMGGEAASDERSAPRAIAQDLRGKSNVIGLSLLPLVTNRLPFLPFHASPRSALSFKNQDARMQTLQIRSSRLVLIGESASKDA
ncbi:hypothetical protein C8R44DRAFT_865701 [Mycena epipterygia]|nr:hypothetical protein C8R44DRAFT_865701 [Mycena epipterygia]